MTSTSPSQPKKDPVIPNSSSGSTKNNNKSKEDEDRRTAASSSSVPAPPPPPSTSSTTIHRTTSSASSVTSRASSTISVKEEQPQNVAAVTPEQRLPRTWRNIASCVVTAMAKAQGACGGSTNAVKTEETTAQSSSTGQITAQDLKALDESVLVLLRTRLEYHRLMSHIDAKLRGQQDQREALLNFVRSQPRIGAAKRSRRKRNQEEAALLQPEDAEAEQEGPAIKKEKA